MSLSKLFVANRAEIAIRVMRAARELGIATVAAAPVDDVGCLHTRIGDDLVDLPGRGVAAYLDVDAVVGAAVERGCDALHPGYGFLAENPVLARGLRSGRRDLRRADRGPARTVRRQDRVTGAGVVAGCAPGTGHRR